MGSWHLRLRSECNPTELPWGRDSAVDELLCVFDGALRPEGFVCSKLCRGEGYSRVAAATSARSISQAGAAGAG
jgi:hypothetical protein